MKIAGFLAGAALLGGVVLVLTQNADARGIFPYEDPREVAAGHKIYGEFCADCHGAKLEGQENWREIGEDGLRPAPPHDASGHTWHHPDEQLFLLVKHGVAALVGGDYESAMPGYGDVLSDTEILQVMAYIKSTWPQDIIETHNTINARAAVD